MLFRSKTFTDKNALQIVRINNSSGVNISSKMEISNHLQLDKRELGLKPGATLHLGAQATTAGASSNSYVNAPLSKAISGNESFEFPLGEGGRYGAFTVKDKTTTGGNWIVKYHNVSPPSRDNKENIAYISNNEYWAVTAPSSGAEADPTLRWDDESGINPVDFDVVSFELDVANPIWKVVPKSVVDYSGKKVSVENLTHNGRRYYSFGLKIAPKIDDYTWIGLESSNWFDPLNWYGKKVPSAATPALITTAENVQPNYWPVIDRDGKAIAQVNDLIVESVLTLDIGGRLTVNGDLTINGDFTLKNTYTPNGLASLITHGAVTGKTSVQLTLPNNEWYYLSSPMKNPDYSHFGAGKDGARVYAYRDRKSVV